MRACVESGWSLSEGSTAKPLPRDGRSRSRALVVLATGELRFPDADVADDVNFSAEALRSMAHLARLPRLPVPRLDMSVTAGFATIGGRRRPNTTYGDGAPYRSEDFM